MTKINFNQHNTIVDDAIEEILLKMAYRAINGDKKAEYFFEHWSLKKEIKEFKKEIENLKPQCRFYYEIAEGQIIL